MKWRYILPALLALCVLLAPRPALSATTYTYAFDEKNNLVRTQDAYLPDQLVVGLGLNAPEDLFMDGNDRLYIADTGNRRIVLYDTRTGTQSGEISHTGFRSPKGVFVTATGRVYVADSGAQAVFVFESDGTLAETITRPDEPAFSDTNFAPSRVAADNHGNIFLVGEGVYSGIIQLSSAGEFLGYFTVNRTRLTLEQAFKFLFYTKEQKDASTDRVPTTFSSVFIDAAGRVYTTTMGTLTGGLKKHNTAGGSTFAQETINTIALSDVTTDRNGIIFVGDSFGQISVYTDTSEMIFRFGGAMGTDDIVGQFKELMGIAVDSRGNVWALDRVKAMVQSFSPTEYASRVFEALWQFNNGHYEESLALWNDVLMHNQMSVLAHNSAGKCYLYLQDYEQAMLHFKVAGNRAYYAEAFWEVRNDFLQDNLPYLFAALIVLALLPRVVRLFDKKKRLRSVRQAYTARIANTPLIGPVSYFVRVPFHPFDRYYDIRVDHKGTAPGATAIYLMMLVVFMLFQTAKGFQYQTVSVVEMDLSAILIGFFALPGLYIVCNFLVSTVYSGDGTLKQIYIYVAYSLMPLMAAMLINIGLSYILSYNESFFYQLVLTVGACWTIVLFMIGLQEMHQYSMGTAVRSVLLTIGMMLVIFVMLLIVIVMWDQFSQFLIALFKEALSIV